MIYRNYDSGVTAALCRAYGIKFAMFTLIFSRFPFGELSVARLALAYTKPIVHIADASGSHIYIGKHKGDVE